MARFRFGRRRRSFGRMVRRARPIVRAVSGITLVKRVMLDGVAIPAETAANYDNPLVFDLIACTEAQDEDVESTGGTTAGTDVAQVPLYSRLTAIRLKFGIRGSAGQNFRWILIKSPDNDITPSSLSNTSEFFNSSNDSQSAREIRKNTIAKGFFMLDSSALAGGIPIFVKKAALRRVGSLRETDRLKFVIASDSSASATLHGFGTLYLKANA